MKKQGGFSLTEAMTTIAIIGVTSIFAQPSIELWKKQSEQRGELRQMVGTLMRAKLEAIKENRFVVVQFTQTGYTAFVDGGANGGTPKDWTCQEGEREFVSHKNIDGLTLSTNFPSDRMRFTGNVGIKAGSITFSRDEKPFAKVVLSLTGRVRVEKL
jgi:Tfp pilus assembly protein FimT